MNLDRPLTRRRWLALSGAAVAALAGCSTDPPQAQTPTGSVFERRSFEGSDLRIDLREGHDVDGLNLIGPDGRLYSQTNVVTGETMISLQLLDIKPEGAGFDHYTPGSHDLIAISGDEELERTSIDLQPELRIVDVRQYRDGTDANDSGKLVVEVENVGSGPTWVYDVTYENAPNFVANSELSDDPGVILLEYPENPESSIILPGSLGQFIGLIPPLEFKSETDQDCAGSYEFDVLVGAPLSTLVTAVTAIVDGDPGSSGLTGQYTCSEISVSIG